MNYFPRTLNGLRTINADHITGITFTGIEIDNFEQYLLGVSRIVGVSSANLSLSIALINNEINNLSTSGLATETNLANFKIESGVSGIIIGVSCQNLDDDIYHVFDSINSLLQIWVRQYPI